MRRICTKDVDFKRESDSLFQAYLKRGYPPELLKQHQSRSALLTQAELLKTTTKEKNDRQVLVMKYNPDNPDVKQLIRKCWPILHTNRALWSLFKEEPMVAYRRQKNLKDYLVKAKIDYPPTVIPRQVYQLKNTTCPVITCKYCKLLNKKWTLTSSFMQTNHRVRIGCRISCRTTNVVYTITCQKCKLQYVGETKRELRRRMYEHVRSIEQFGKPGIQATPVADHFNHDCKRPAKLQFQIVETIRADPTKESTTNLRRKRETFWILTLRTLEPMGMNVFV
jgi:hypothetical protein